MPLAEIVDFGELAGLAAGCAIGLGVIVAVAIALSAWIRAGDAWRRREFGGALMLGTASGVLGLAALAGIAYGLSVIAESSPVL